MKTTTNTTKVTKLIVAKTFTLTTEFGKKTYKAGRVLEVVKHKVNHYHAWPHRIVFGHGWTETVPVENLKVKWLVETKTTTTETKEVKVA